MYRWRQNAKYFHRQNPFLQLTLIGGTPTNFTRFEGNFIGNQVGGLEAKEQSLVLAGHIQHCFLLHPRVLVLQLLKLLVS